VSKLLKALFDEMEFQLAGRAAQSANVQNARLRSEIDRLHGEREASNLETQDLLNAQSIITKVETWLSLQRNRQCVYTDKVVGDPPVLGLHLRNSRQSPTTKRSLSQRSTSGCCRQDGAEGLGAFSVARADEFERTGIGRADFQ